MRECAVSCKIRRKNHKFFHHAHPHITLSYENDVKEIKRNFPFSGIVVLLLQISIDNKTERAATLEQELKTKEDRLLKTEEDLTEARKKLR
jgi:hypothetical protein